MKNYKKTTNLVFFGFFFSGFFVLAIGTIMPDFINSFGLSFTEAGAILSMFALGNLLSNFVYPLINLKLGDRLSATITIATIPLGFFLIGLVGDKLQMILPLMFLIMGIGRGAISIISNIVINDLSENKTKSINLLHTIWALGAFLSAFVILILKKLSFNFNAILYFLTFVTAIMWASYSIIDYDYEITAHSEVEKEITSKPLDIYFYSISIFMFFYLGLENTVNGWLMTYLQNMNIISDTLSSSIVSLTWLMIMMGRIFTAYISDKVDGTKIVMIYVLGISAMVVSLLFASNQWVVFTTMLVLGFFLSAVYPTSISNASDYVVGNQKNMAILLTSAAVGGMITPQIIGIVADKTSILFAMNVIIINIIFMLIFAYVSRKLFKKMNV